MTLLVFGVTGQVARELATLRPEATYLTQDQADLGDPAACMRAIEDHAPEAVINAAAYTAVDQAETDVDLAHQINADAPGAMARACSGNDIPFIHISTDYVFDGSGSVPWDVDAPTGPLGVYGASKLAGEVAVQAAGGRYAVLRTSWVFSAHGSNFVKSMLRLSESHKELNIVDDQVGGPTPAQDVASACLHIADVLKKTPDKAGLYHYSGAPDVSWKDFAKAIFAAANRPVAVTGIPARDYPTPARRPNNSRLNCATTYKAFGLAQPDWRNGLIRVLGQLEDE